MDAAFVTEWVAGKTPADFDIMEFGGRVLWPDKIRRLKKSAGSAPTFEEFPVLLQVPRFDEELMAAADAERILADRGIVRGKSDRYEQFLEQLEVFAKVARAIREPKPPHAQWRSVDVLIATKETGIEVRELFGVWQRLEVYAKMQDARIAEIDEPLAVQMAYAITEARNLSPLVAIAGAEVDSFVISMASTLVRCLTDRSYSPSLATSTRARSRKSSSA